jgi:hypothetical protein
VRRRPSARWYSAPVWYELWDSETGNRVGKYPTEQAALEAVAEDVTRYGRDSEAVLTLGLLRRDPDDLVAEGVTLVERALACTATTRTPANASGAARPRTKTPKR